MKIIVNGANGRMGKLVTEKALSRGMLACAVDKNNEGEASYPIYSSLFDFTGDADVIIDFSHYLATRELTEYALRRSLPVVIATTGHTPTELAMIEEASKHIPIFHSANMSLGIALLIELAKTAAAKMPGADIEIIEKHHDRKLDAPSGTALLIADALREVRPELYNHAGRSGSGKRDPNEIGISAVRAGSIVGEHEVMIATDSQTITLKHEAHDRGVFADGAFSAAMFLIGKQNGLYTMKDVASEK